MELTGVDQHMIQMKKEDGRGVVIIEVNCPLSELQLHSLKAEVDPNEDSISFGICTYDRALRYIRTLLLLDDS